MTGVGVAVGFTVAVGFGVAVGAVVAVGSATTVGVAAGVGVPFFSAGSPVPQAQRHPPVIITKSNTFHFLIQKPP
jgi:hypothetical protein